MKLDYTDLCRHVKRTAGMVRSRIRIPIWQRVYTDIRHSTRTLVSFGIRDKVRFAGPGLVKDALKGELSEL